jgi:hypothetical protein
MTGMTPEQMAAALGKGLLARSAERAGADGLLLLPPYLTEFTREGLGRVCGPVRSPLTDLTPAEMDMLAALVAGRQ